MDYWGTYRGKDIYQYYGKEAAKISTENPDKVIAVRGTFLYKGVPIGKYEGTGEVLDWCPEAAEKKRLDVEFKFTTASAEVKEVKVEDILDGVFKKSLKDMLIKF